MAEGAIAASIIGTGVSIYGQRKAANAQERAARSQADAKAAQAEDLLDRFAINSEMLKLEGESFVQRQQASYISGGVGGATTLLAMEETYKKLYRQMRFEKMEAEQKAAALRSGAAIDAQLAGDIRATKNLQSAGLFLQGAGNVSGAYANYYGK